MSTHYLEIVTNDVEQNVAIFESMQGLTFGEPIAELGNARTATRPKGGTVGIRAPMHDAELPIVRPYYLTEDIAEAINKLEKLGAEIALAPMVISGHGTIAIYIVDGLHYGLWQV